MLAAFRSEPVREPEEIFLEDRVQHGDRCLLDDLVLKSRDRERALTTIWLRNVPPPGWLCPVRSPVDPFVQFQDPMIEACLVVLPRQPVHTGGGVPLEGEERRPEHLRAEMVEERGEPFLLPVLAACRTRSSAWDTLARSCARRVLCWRAFPSVPALRSTGSAAGFPALFVGFDATMARSDFS